MLRRIQTQLEEEVLLERRVRLVDRDVREDFADDPRTLLGQDVHEDDGAEVEADRDAVRGVLGDDLRLALPECGAAEARSELRDLEGAGEAVGMDRELGHVADPPVRTAYQRHSIRRERASRNRCRLYRRRRRVFAFPRPSPGRSMAHGSH
jgi:hypothetical protein